MLEYFAIEIERQIIAVFMVMTISSVDRPWRMMQNEAQYSAHLLVAAGIENMLMPSRVDIG